MFEQKRLHRILSYDQPVKTDSLDTTDERD